MFTSYRWFGSWWMALGGIGMVGMAVDALVSGSDAPAWVAVVLVALALLVLCGGIGSVFIISHRNSPDANQDFQASTGPHCTDPTRPNRRGTPGTNTPA